MKRQNWIYQIRGLAIIAVVICHQQHLLHESEIIQLFSLYSVTTLIFLMGVTKSNIFEITFSSVRLTNVHINVFFESDGAYIMCIYGSIFFLYI